MAGRHEDELRLFPGILVRVPALQIFARSAYGRDGPADRESTTEVPLGPEEELYHFSFAGSNGGYVMMAWASCIFPPLKYFFHESGPSP